MQHHSRQTHLRLTPHTNNIQIHPTPVPMLPGQPPTQQQQPSHIKVTTQTTEVTPQMPTTQTQSMPNASNTHMREQLQNRPNNHKHMPATQMQHNQTAQMQKIRQQHQHLNHKINAGNNNANQTQYANHINVQRQQSQNSHVSGSQQQQQTMHRNVPNTHNHQQQQQLNSLPLKNHAPPGALKVILPSNNARQTTTTTNQQQQYNYNYSGSKPKFNNNNNNNNTTKPATNFSTPRAILQNPNRVTAKSTTPQTTSTTRSNVTTTLDGTNENVIDEGSSSKDKPKEIVTNSATAEEPAVDIQNSIDSPQSSNHNSPEKVFASSNSEANKENITETNTNVCSRNGNSKILCNNDDSISKNCKEKTPMCLVNELARYNKITHQYRLTNENGPAHSKRFTVTLKLGNEEYTADGFKIKKAQHAAAALALEQTSYKHPVPKAIRNHDDSRPRPYIMPTVELNALAMKLGQQTYYLFDPRQMPPSTRSNDMHETSIPTHHHYGGPRPTMQPPTHNNNHMMPLPPQTRMIPEVTPYGQRRHFDGGYCASIPPPPPPPPHLAACPAQRPYGGGGHHQRNGYPMMQRYQRYPLIPPPPPSAAGIPPHLHHYGMPVTPYKITLIVGKQKFVGTGRTLQHAKHDAASRALQVLKNQATEEQQKDDLDESMDENDLKSPISQVHEAGIKRNLSVHFKIIREEGPAHMRNFITACIMGSLVTEGEGHGKKISKKRAAEKMLLEIKKLPPVNTPIKTPTKRLKTKTPNKHENKKNAAVAEITEIGSGCGVEREKREKRGKLEKGEKIEKGAAKEKANENEEETPVTRLLQLMQSRKQKEPVFEYIAKHNTENIRRREHIFEVSALGRVARGTAVNKKLAKQTAAENLLKIFEAENENSDSTNDSADDEETIPAIPEDTHKKLTQEKTPSKTSNTPKLLDPLDLPIVSTTAGQVPGILILRPNKKPPLKKKETTAVTTTTTTSVTTTPTRTVKAIAKRIDVDAAASSNQTDSNNDESTKPETLQAQLQNEPATATVVSATTLTNTNSTTSTTITTTTVDSNDKPAASNTSSSSSAAPSLMKHQLLYLAKLLGFEVNFSDFPKGNHNEFLTIVSLSTDPPQMCHGFGPSTEESQNDAARNALKILSDLGLNNAKSN